MTANKIVALKSDDKYGEKFDTVLNNFEYRLKVVTKSIARFYWPIKEAAMGIIVVSLSCTAYLCGSFIVLWIVF
ncbi:MAG: hypothetical protein H7211_08850 [Aquabacterium sp.]|nr:hypothetical protein [Ferruginibacter sp.]